MAEASWEEERISGRHMRLARIFLYGPEGTRGDFRAAAVAAGYVGKSPTVDGSVMRAAFQAAREFFDNTREVTADPDMEDLQRQMVASPGDWAAMAPLAKRVLGKIATGQAEPRSGQQVVALKEIILRAEGGAGRGQAEAVTETYNVVVLPAINTDMGLVVDLAEVTDEDEVGSGVAAAAREASAPAKPRSAVGPDKRLAVAGPAEQAAARPPSAMDELWGG